MTARYLLTVMKPTAPEEILERYIRASEYNHAILDVL